MSYSEDVNPYTSMTDRSITGWVGWIVFAAVIMIVSGGFSIIAGLGALFRDESYFVTSGAVLTFDYTSWGWIHLIFGILLVIVGVLLLQGSTFARVLGLILVTLNLFAQFAWLDARPFWAIVVIAVDILVLYAITIHGRELKME